MQAATPTRDELADMVRERRAASTAGYKVIGRQRFDLRVDDAVRQVAAELDMDWRDVLRAYRAKYPLRWPI